MFTIPLLCFYSFSFQCVNVVKKIQNKYISEYMSCWFGKETRTMNIITTHLDTLEDFIGKVKTLRWRIVKKWAKQILRGLDHLHQQKPEVVHRNVTCAHIYIDRGLGSINIGDLWLAAIIAEDQDNPIGLSDAMMQQLADGSIAYTAPENFLDPHPLLTSKVDIYSFGMCLLEMIVREEPYGECLYKPTARNATNNNSSSSGSSSSSKNRYVSPLYLLNHYVLIISI